MTTRPKRSINDPLLKSIPAGADHEPRLRKLLKEPTATGEPAGSEPRGGRTTLDGARRGGLLGVLQLLGPGLITGASDDDPSGIGTYSQVGTQFGFGVLWTALFTFPL